MSYDHPMAIVPLLSSRQDNYMMVPGMVGFWISHGGLEVFFVTVCQRRDRKEKVDTIEAG
eukprot:scaffold7738_cov116-Skeletonema_dohrnii-CCMP3373.AAC.1